MPSSVSDIIDQGMQYREILRNVDEAIELVARSKDLDPKFGGAKLALARRIPALLTKNQARLLNFEKRLTTSEIGTTFGGRITQGEFNFLLNAGLQLGKTRQANLALLRTKRAEAMLGVVRSKIMSELIQANPKAKDVELKAMLLQKMEPVYMDFAKSRANTITLSKTATPEQKREASDIFGKLSNENDNTKAEEDQGE